MANIKNEFVKMYDDKFLYLTVKYMTKIYGYYTSSNKIALNVEPIDRLCEVAQASNWDLKALDEDKEKYEYDFQHVMASRWAMQIDETAFWQTVSMMKIGEGLSDLRKSYKETCKSLNKKRNEEGWRLADYKNIDVFCAYISKPEIRRSVESPKGVFDYIDVLVGLSMLAPEDELLDLIKYFKTDITEKVIDLVRDDNRFKKYHVPINMIKIDKITFNRSSRVLHYLLSLKLN